MKHIIKRSKHFSLKKIHLGKHLVLELKGKMSFPRNTLNNYHNLLKFPYATKFITIII